MSSAAAAIATPTFEVAPGLVSTRPEPSVFACDGLAPQPLEVGGSREECSLQVQVILDAQSSVHRIAAGDGV